MPTMRAALVTSFEEPPHLQQVPVPHAGPGQERLEVLAAAIHPRVRSGAAGSHYTSTGALPMIPGVDGVGRTSDGRLLYFAAPDDTGSMAQLALFDPQASIELPAGTDVDAVAAGMNPAMSSWVALRRRTSVVGGRTVLVLGATGNAGTMAVRIATHLGAGRIIAVGRDATRLSQLTDMGPVKTIQLTEDPGWAQTLAAEASEADVVLDYLWGRRTEHAIVAMVQARRQKNKALDWVQIGSMAGTDITLPSAALRAANLRLLGSGQGAVGGGEYLAELPALVELLTDGTLPIHTRPAALDQVEQVWTEPEPSGVRTVLKP